MIKSLIIHRPCEALDTSHIGIIPFAEQTNVVFGTAIDGKFRSENQVVIDHKTHAWANRIDDGIGYDLEVVEMAIAFALRQVSPTDDNLFRQSYSDRTWAEIYEDFFNAKREGKGQ